MSYPVTVNTTFGDLDIAVTVRGPKDENGDREVRLEYSGARTGVLDPFTLNKNLPDETREEYRVRHFGFL